MFYQWRPVFTGEVDGRNVRLEIGENEDFKLTTTQKGIVSTKGSIESGSTVLPVLISHGDVIEIYGVNADELQENLVIDGNFTKEDAAKITRFARFPKGNFQ